MKISYKRISLVFLDRIIDCLYMEEEKKVRYFRHFKGGKYKLVAVAKDSETLEQMVVYQALYGEREYWVRPYGMFFGTVVRDGVERQRFTEITEEEALA